MENHIFRFIITIHALHLVLAIYQGESDILMRKKLKPALIEKNWSRCVTVACLKNQKNLREKGEGKTSADVISCCIYVEEGGVDGVSGSIEFDAKRCFFSFE